MISKDIHEEITTDIRVDAISPSYLARRLLSMVLEVE
jgi:hypothetical protein